MKALQEERALKRAAAKSVELERQNKRAAKKAEKRALANQQKKAAAEKRRIQELDRKAKADARRAAFEEYQKTPAYAAKLARAAAKIAAMKKTHLQVWIEEETNLRADRITLREKWRARLLKRPMDSD